jgi:hypothetical protein
MNELLFKGVVHFRPQSSNRRLNHIRSGIKIDVPNVLGNAGPRDDVRRELREIMLVG